MPAVPEDIDMHDSAPLSLIEVLRLDPGAGEEHRAMQRNQKVTRSKGIAPPGRQATWEKKDVVAKGIYKPWFFTRFARLWIPLGKPQCAMDLKSICLASKSHTRRHPKGKRLHDDSSDKSGVEEDVWVGCDSCSKWRKVPRGFELDKDKSFFCYMLKDTTCATPEEEWGDDEEFVDDTDLVDEGTRGSPHSAHSDSSQRETPSTRVQDSGKMSRSYSHPNDPTNNWSTVRHAGKRKLVSPHVFGAEHDDDEVHRWKPARRTGGDDAPHSRSATDENSVARVNRGGGGQGMSRLDAVVRVLKSTGRPLHYDVITRQALQLGIIRFTGSQGTAGESMKAFLNKTIRENKSAAIINMGKGVYGLKEWGRAGVVARDSSTSWHTANAPVTQDGKDFTLMSSNATSSGGSHPTSPDLSSCLKSLSTSPVISANSAACKLTPGAEMRREIRDASKVPSLLPALVLPSPELRAPAKTAPASGSGSLSHGHGTCHGTCQLPALMMAKFDGGSRDAAGGAEDACRLPSLPRCTQGTIAGLLN